MITFKIIHPQKIRELVEESSDDFYSVTESEMNEFCSDGNGTYGYFRYEGDMSDFMSEMNYLYPNACMPPQFKESDGYSLSNICAVAAVVSAELGLKDKLLLFFNDVQKYVEIICDRY